MVPLSGSKLPLCRSTPMASWIEALCHRRRNLISVQAFQAPATPTEANLGGSLGWRSFVATASGGMTIFLSSADILCSRRRRSPAAIKHFAWKRLSVRCSRPRQSPGSRFTSTPRAAARGATEPALVIRLRATDLCRFHMLSSGCGSCSSWIPAIRSTTSRWPCRITGPFDAHRPRSKLECNRSASRIASDGVPRRMGRAPAGNSFGASRET